MAEIHGIGSSVWYWDDICKNRKVVLLEGDHRFWHFKKYCDKLLFSH